jgi:hypothetical protein
MVLLDYFGDKMLTFRVKKLALRFHYTMSNFGYWDISLNALRHLIDVGLVAHNGCGRYAITSSLLALSEEEQPKKILEPA